MLQDIIFGLTKKIFKEVSYKVNIEKSKNPNSDLAIPLFSLAKETKEPIIELANKIEPIVKTNQYIQSCFFVGGFLNINLNKEKYIKAYFTKSKEIKNKKETILIDFSSPNIAKSFSVGHIRSTVIGNSLSLINKYLGNTTVGINYLGDWGTQFGKVVASYLLWGDKTLGEDKLMSELQRVYQLFHENAEQDPSLEDKARQVFKEMESGNPEYIQLWKVFKDKSVEEFKKIYQELNISFDVFSGESLYNSKIAPMIEVLKKKKLLVENDGCYVIKVPESDNPAIIIKSNGSTSYLTRDLAAIIDRYNEYKFDRILYVVGNEQSQHFSHLSYICQKLGYKFKLEHVNFGLVLRDGKKMSTREGNAITLSSLLSTTYDLAYNVVKDKTDLGLPKEDVAKIITNSAIFYNDLKNDRILDINYDYDEMIRFDGNTGPYLQYTYARISSILKQIQPSEILNKFFSLLCSTDHYNLTTTLDDFNQTLLRASKNSEPSILSKYLYKLSKEFNSLYAKTKFLTINQVELDQNYVFLEEISRILKTGINLLGITCLDKM